MCYYAGKRHIGGEGRANETGLPPTLITRVERTPVHTRWTERQR
jgi:hypothetical protein